MMVLFLKAAIPGGALGDLFDARVQVKGHTRKNGAFVAPHQTTVHKRHDEPKPAAEARLQEGFGAHVPASGSRRAHTTAIHPSREAAAAAAFQAVPSAKTVQTSPARRGIVTSSHIEFHDRPVAAKPAASDDSKLLEGLPDGSRFTEGRGPLGRGQWGVEHEGKLIWNLHPSKEVAAKEARDAVARRKAAEDDKAQSAARDADIAKRIHAGEDPTDADLKHLGLNTGGKHSRFDYLSPAVQRVFGISKPKVREAMGDSLVEASNDGGTKTHWGKPAKVLKNAAAWSRASKPAVDKPGAPAKAHFYVSAVDGSRKHLVAGPYGSHGEALGMVEHVRKHADSDPRAHFMAWGTAGSDEEHKTPLGKGWKPPAA
jgi:hypothetical protein